MIFPIWKTITIGTFTTIDGLRSAILDKGFRIGDWAEDVLASPTFTLATERKEINLVKVTPKDLGFNDGSYREDIYSRAQEASLRLCPLEVGPQLRLKYTDQPKMESLQIGMETQTDSVGHPSQFRVVHGGDNFLWLVGDHKHDDDFWRADELFVFVNKF